MRVSGTLDAPHVNVFLVLAGLREIVGHLLPQPGLRAAAKGLVEPQGHFAREAGHTIKQAGEGRARDLKRRSRNCAVDVAYLALNRSGIGNQIIDGKALRRVPEISKAMHRRQRLLLESRCF